MHSIHSKKLLFVLPGYSLGGTTSSLYSLLNSDFSSKYDVEVFVINRRSCTPTSLAPYDIGLNSLTTAFNSDFSTFSTLERLCFLPIKLMKQVPALRESLKKWVEHRTIKKIEHRKKYDFVVAFQEENTTKFTSNFHCPNKIAWIHCDYDKSFPRELDETELYEQYRKIVCVSDFTRQSFIGRYPSLSERTVAIHNIFDAESVIAKSKDSIDDPRYDQSLFTILSLGRITEVKQFYLIPVIAAKLKEAGVVFRWYIMGGGNNENDLRRVIEAIAQYNVENEVIFLGGKANPYPYLKAADLLVSTSKSEACPMIFNEAKLLNVPILSADFGSAYEFIEQGTDGFISPIEEMHGKIIELSRDPKMLCKMKERDNYIDSNETILKKLEALFAY